MITDLQQKVGELQRLLKTTSLNKDTMEGQLIVGLVDALRMSMAEIQALNFALSGVPDSGFECPVCGIRFLPSTMDDVMECPDCGTFIGLDPEAGEIPDLVPCPVCGSQMVNLCSDDEEDEDCAKEDEEGFDDEDDISPFLEVGCKSCGTFVALSQELPEGHTLRCPICGGEEFDIIGGEGQEA